MLEGKELRRAVEAVLFVTDEPLPAGALAQILEVDRPAVESRDVQQISDQSVQPRRFFPGRLQQLQPSGFVQELAIFDQAVQYSCY